jgi:hypothetical protein
VVEALRLFPHVLQCKIVAVAESLTPVGITAANLARCLDFEPRMNNTLIRAVRAVEGGVSPEQLFTIETRGPGVSRSNVVKLVVDFFQLVSVPANTGRRLEHFPEEPQRNLEDPIVRVLLPAFRAAHPDIHMSVGRFVSYRKKYVPFIRSRGDTPHAGCRYCNDMRFRMDALSRNRHQIQCGCLPLPPYDNDLPKKLLCPREEHPWWMSIPCVLGTCGSSCGFRGIGTALCRREKGDKKTMIKWSAWENGIQDGYKVWQVKEQAPLTAVQLWTDTQHYCDVECVASKGWLRHIVTGRVMHEARQELLRKLAPTDALIGVDYARQYEFYNNFMIPQQAYTSAKATILVVYVAQHSSRTNIILEDDEGDEDDGEDVGYDEDEEKEEKPHIKYETYFFVMASSDNNSKKNAGIVHYALEQVFSSLNVGKPGGTERVFIVSDGEFRQRAHFAWLGATAKSLTTDMFWSFYSSNHGKDLYDKEGGVFKCSARKYVRDKGTRDSNPINTISDLVAFGRNHLAVPSSGGKVQRRHFFHIQDKLPVPPDAVPVEWSSLLYAFRVEGSKNSNTVHARPFACFCDGCLRFASCTRRRDPWKETTAGYL